MQNEGSRGRATPPLADSPALTEDFLRLYSRYQKQIYAFIGTFLRSPTDIEEVLQETSIVLWSKFEEFEANTNFFGWACRVARLEVYRLSRSRKGVMLPFDDRLFEVLVSDQQRQQEYLQQRLDALQSCLDRLKGGDRQLVEACYRPGATIKSAAEQIHRPVNAVYQSLSRIRRLLHDCIGRSLASREA